MGLRGTGAGPYMTKQRGGISSNESSLGFAGQRGRIDKSVSIDGTAGSYDHNET